MAKQQKQWKTSRGEDVPASAISAYDKRKESAVDRIMRKANHAHLCLKELKVLVADELDTVYKEHLKRKGFTEEDRKGNFTMTNYDKSVKIEVSNSSIITFDENIELVKLKLDEYIEKVTGDTTSDLRKLVQNAFKTRKGNLDKARLLSLFEYNITDPLWKAAMDLLRESIKVVDTKRYFEISTRQEDGSYKTLVLNFAGIE